MNLADYLSELLGQYDEVSVPGLGYFVRTRINAYFNEAEARFYPPYHQVKFVAQLKEDDTFAQYVADKKNISLASSKYFVEKFIGKLKEDARTGKFLFSDLGSFQTEQDQLVFKPTDRIPADPAFYGYPPVGISRQGQPLSAEQRKPVFTQNQTGQSPRSAAPAPPVQTISPPEYYEEETEPKRGISVWLIILIALVIAAMGVFAVFKFYPSVFDRFKEEFNKITGKTASTASIASLEKKTDSIKKKLPVKDSTIKTVTTTASQDSLNKSHFDIIVGDYGTPSLADYAVKHFKDLGVNARILNLSEATGPRIKVSAGSFPTTEDAQVFENKLISEHKILPSSYIIETKPQK
jgi:hypothetical protein